MSLIKKKEAENIVIIGCGRLGAHIANVMSKERKNLIVIDKDEESFKKLSDEFSGFTIESDATEHDTFILAKIKNSDVVIITTGNDSTNIMIAQITKQIFKVPKVIARIFEPSRVIIYQELGIDTICPATLSAIEFKRLIGEDWSEN